MRNIFRPTRVKIIIHLILSVSLVLVSILLPASGLGKIFSELSLAQKISSFFISWLASFIIYYPLTFGVAYLASSVRNSIYDTGEIILASIFIIIFNPITLAFASSMFFTKNATVPNNNTGNAIQSESVCGLAIIDFTIGSKAEEAGVEKDDVILKLNQAQIRSIQDIFDQLAKKKPGDKVSLETDKGTRTVELMRNAKDPNAPALGVVLAPYPCKK